MKRFLGIMQLVLLLATFAVTAFAAAKSADGCNGGTTVCATGDGKLAGCTGCGSTL